MKQRANHTKHETGACAKAGKASSGSSAAPASPIGKPPPGPYQIPIRTIRRAVKALFRERAAAVDA